MDTAANPYWSAKAIPAATIRSRVRAFGASCWMIVSQLEETCVAFCGDTRDLAFDKFAVSLLQCTHNSYAVQNKSLSQNSMFKKIIKGSLLVIAAIILVAGVYGGI